MKLSYIVLILFLIIPSMDISYNVDYDNYIQTNLLLGDETDAYSYWNAPDNSFGVDSFVIWNMTWIKNKIKNNVDWILETNTGSGWYNNNDKLNIGLKWNDSGFFKIWMNVSDLEFGNHRITFGFNQIVMDYFEKDNYELWINKTVGNETLRLFFNFSDLKGLGLVFSHGIKNDMFWWRMQKDDFQGSYSFDPQFGETSTSGSFDNLEDNICYSNFTAPASGTIDFIKIYCDPVNNDFTVGCALYKTSDNSLVDSTVTHVMQNANTSAWHQFNFTSPPSIVSGTEYALTAWSSSGSGAMYLHYVSNNSNQCCYDWEAYDGNWPNPKTVTLERDNNAYCIYAGYTVSGWSNTCPVLSSESPSNNSNNVAVDVGNFSFTINDVDGNNTWGNISCNNSDTGTWNNKGNGTKGMDLSTLTCGATYTIWVNYTDGHCNKNESFTFTTVACGCVEFGNTNHGTPTPANNSYEQPTSFTWQISITEDDGCNGFNYTIQCSNGQSKSQNGVVNGTKTLSISGLGYYSNYTVWVNSSNYDGTNFTRNWFNFTTANTSVWSFTPEWVNITFVSEGDMMDINLDPSFMGILLVLLFFYLAFKVDSLYKENKQKTIWKPVLFAIDVPISMATGIALLGNDTYSVLWWIGIAMFCFAVVLSMGITYYALKFGR